MIINLPLREVSESLKTLIVEYIGTFFLVLTVALSDGDGSVDGLAIGFQLMTQVFAYGYISGGHYNPAVTGGVMFSGIITVGTALSFWASQLLGGTMAAMLAWNLRGDVTRLAVPMPAEDTPIGYWRVFLAEFLYTFSLASIVLNVACSRQKENHHYGLAIGMTILAGVYSVGDISGGAFNPAVATALQLVHCMGDSCKPLTHIWLYWVAEISACFFSAVVFRLIHPADLAHRPEMDTNNQALQHMGEKERLM